MNNDINPWQAFLESVYDTLNISRIWWRWRQDKDEKEEEEVEE